MKKKYKYQEKEIIQRALQVARIGIIVPVILAFFLYDEKKTFLAWLVCAVIVAGSFLFGLECEHCRWGHIEYNQQDMIKELKHYFLRQVVC